MGNVFLDRGLGLSVRSDYSGCSFDFIEALVYSRLSMPLS